MIDVTWIFVLALGFLALVGLLIYFSIYNNLIAKRNQVENIESSIDVTLTKRHDLIPNLIGAVRAYMQHESETLTAIVDLRNRAANHALDPAERMKLEDKLTSSLGKIMVSVEAYPELKASQNFLQLQASLNEIEEQISAARRAFNAAVTALNNAIEMFPSSLVASGMNLERRSVFEIASPAYRENVNVASSFGL